MEDTKLVQTRRGGGGDLHPCLRSKKALTELHQRCLEYVHEKNVSYLDQGDVTDLLGGPSEVKPSVVADIMTQMVSQNMVQLLVAAEGQLLCKVIEENKGVDLSLLNKDEHLVYTRIQHADNQGIWSQSLARQLNMGKVVLDKCLKSLESKRIIKKVKSVKHGYRIIYMLYNLEPSADLTGGPWYDDSKELDVPFVNSLLDIAYRFVDKRSFPPMTKKETSQGIRKVPAFYQPAYRDYATAEDVYEFIIKSEVLDASIKDIFGVSHVHKLLEVLCYNNQIQKRTDGETYRSIVPDDELLPPEEVEYYENETFEADQADALFGHKGYTEAPCGRCPVFSICGNPGEDVSAATCKYWDEWTSKVTSVEYF